MIRRAASLAFVILVAIDRLAQTIIFGVPYLLDLGPRPAPGDSISAVTGRAAIAGKSWALIAEPIIDWIFEQLGDAPGHCRRAAAEADA